MSDMNDVLATLKGLAMAEPSPEGVVPIHTDITLDGDVSPETHIIYIADCVYCKGDTGIRMLRTNWDEWQSGVHAQNVWANASVDDRETLISGTHSVCFDKLFAGEEE